MAKRKITQLLTALILIISIAIPQFGYVSADGDLVFSDEFDTAAPNASKAVKSDNVYEVTSQSSQLGDESRLTRSAGGKAGYAIYEFPAKVTYIIYRAVNGTGDSLETSLYTSPDMENWTKLEPALKEAITGFSGYPGAEYTFVNFPASTKYVKLEIPGASGDEAYVRQVTFFKMYSGGLPDTIPKDAFYSKIHYFDTDSYTEAEKLIYGLGVLEGGILIGDKLDTRVKRGEFAEMVTKLVLGDSGVFSTYDITGRYTDVNKDTKYAGSIAFVTDNDYMREVTGNRFLPEENLTRDQLCFTLLNVLGYKTHLEQTGLNPVMLAVKEKLIPANLTDKGVTYRAVASALYEMINSRYMIQDVNKYTESNSTYLEREMKIEKKEGQITETSLGCLTGESRAEETEVLIDGAKYTYGDIFMNQHLGKFVEFYYKTNRETDERTIISYTLKDNKAKTLKIGAEYILPEASGFSLSKFVYENEKGRQTSVKMDIDFLTVNGERKFEITKDDFKIKDGSVTLVDSDADNVYDTVMIEEYRDFFVETVSKPNMEITGKYGSETVKFHEDVCDHYVILNALGEFSSIQKIKKGNIVSAAVSPSKQYAKIVVSDGAIEGTVSLVGTDGRVKIGDKEYKLSETYINHVNNNSSGIDQIVSGTRGVFYLNFEGKISGVDVDAAVRKYGYLVKAGMESGLSASIQFKISTEEGELKIFDSRPSISVEYKGTKRSYEPSELYQFLLTKNGGTVKEELVKYELDKEGKIRYLALPDKTGDFTVDFEGLAYNTGNGILNDKYGFKTSKIFIIPEDRSREDLYANTMTFRTGKQNSAAVNKYNIQVYDCDAYNVASAVVFERPSLEGQGDGADLWYRPLGVVLSVDSIMDEKTQEIKPLLQVLYNSAVKEYVIEPQVYYGFKPAGFTDVYDLKKGDAIQMGFSPYGQVARIHVWHTHDEKDHFAKGIDGAYESGKGFGLNVNDQNRGYYGKVEQVSTQYITVNDGSDTWLCDASSTMVTVCDMKKGRVYNASVSDISIGDVVVVRSQSGKASNVIIYR